MAYFIVQSLGNATSFCGLFVSFYEEKTATWHHWWEIPKWGIMEHDSS